MSDAELKEKWESVTAPIEALQEIVNNEEFLGGDSYYSDLRNALIAMAVRVLQRCNAPIT